MNNSNNKAVILGSNTNTHLNIYHCTIANNNAGGNNSGAVYTSNASAKLRLYNNIISGNGDGSTAAQYYGTLETTAPTGVNIIQSGSTNNYAAVFGNYAISPNGLLYPLANGVAKGATPMSTAPTGAPTGWNTMVLKDQNSVTRSVTAPYYGAVEFPDALFNDSASGAILDTITSNSVAVTRSLTNSGADPQPCILITALYSSSGELLNCKVSDPKSVATGTDTLTLTIDTSLRGAGSYLSTFLFQDISKIKPLAQKLTMY